ncbi:hypothetical protein GC105_16385 [Alkalibaculum sp. M08DMB]|uniref:Transposase IS200-like domain-containing protein n=1 Tax=Alkalibaculum sporogenes TaxID=2655001 RepID=A0A6A7KD04_9FIRM|nr:transposase [Alkalibaculum sporogenes]MPW27344.1 hypothetical protein [Alkalibaculum sporogenes]
MPRQAQKESKTGYYHIMTRGINKEYIFNDKFQRDMILKIIKEKIQEEPFKVVAYCVMSNHLHIIIHTDKQSLIDVMKKINITYAMSYNRKERRVGALFQERYKSENITDEKYLVGAIRYVHNNPVKAGMVPRVQDYSWSSMAEYLEGNNFLVDEEEKELILDRFNSADEFRKFHDIEDQREYLELREELEEKKEKRAIEIIEAYFIEKGIHDKRQLKDKEELISRLLKQSKLSYRKIAQITETSLNTVYLVSKNLTGKD